MSNTFYISVGEMQTVFCRVSPANPDYSLKYPVYVFYNDGSWSKQIAGQPYYRSQKNSLRKSRDKYTVKEIMDILEIAENGIVTKEFAENCLKDNIKSMKECLSSMVEYKTVYLISALADYEGEHSKFSRILKKIKAAERIIKAQ